MTLGRKYVQASGLTYLLAFLGAEGFPVIEALLIVGNTLVGVGVEPLGPRVALGQLLGIPAEDDVNASASHVGRNSDCTRLASLSHDVCLAGVLLGVQHLMSHTPIAHELAEHLRLLHRRSANEHWLTCPYSLFDVVDDSAELALFTLEDEIGLVFASQRPVRWHLHNNEVVGGFELGGIAERCTGHPSQLVVHPEVVLQRDGGQRLLLFLDLHPFFGFNRLV